MLTETAFVLPGTKINVPRWALLAGGGGLILILFLMKKQGAAATTDTSTTTPDTGGSDLGSLINELNGLQPAPGLTPDTAPGAPSPIVEPPVTKNPSYVADGSTVPAQKSIVEQYHVVYKTGSEATLAAIQNDQLSLVSTLRNSYPDIVNTPEQDQRRAQRAGMTEKVTAPSPTQTNVGTYNNITVSDTMKGPGR
jgi:hypothetical protein